MSLDTNGWLVFDIECSMYPSSEVRGSFYKRAKELLCIATYDVGTGESALYAEDTLEDGVKKVLEAKRLIAHNGRSFDIPALGHLRPEVNKQLRSVPLSDTRWMALKSEKSPHGLLTYGQLNKLDKKLGLSTEYPNSLDAWGQRFKFPKLKMGVENPEEFWSNAKYTTELGEYCVRDVEVNFKLFEWIMKRKGIEF